MTAAFDGVNQVSFAWVIAYFAVQGFLILALLYGVFCK